jgi:hypothetical protein
MAVSTGISENRSINASYSVDRRNRVGDHHVPNGYLSASIKDKINVNYNACRQDTERATYWVTKTVSQNWSQKVQLGWNMGQNGLQS